MSSFDGSGIDGSVRAIYMKNSFTCPICGTDQTELIFVCEKGPANIGILWSSPGLPG